MNWMDKLERKIGKYAIRNITRYLVIATLIGYFLEMMSPQILSWISFSPNAILHGQIWRLVTWVFIPMGGGTIFDLIFLICVLSWGSLLETCLGTFRTNVFVFGGLLISMIGELIAYGVIFLISKPLAADISGALSVSPYYVLLTVLMAIAICMPDTQVLLMFFIPIKMKWMLYITLIEYGYIIFSGFYSGYEDSVSRGFSGVTAVVAGLLTCWVFSGQIILALLNLALFFYFVKKHIPRKQRKRQKEFRKQFEPAKPRAGSGIYQHKCAVCGRTELDDPSLTFRYCSKCEGSYEYCNEHLYSHEHVYRS